MPSGAVLQLVSSTALNRHCHPAILFRNLQMSEVIGDFPLVHPAMYGKQTRYTYQAMTDTQDSAAQNKVSHTFTTPS